MSQLLDEALKSVRANTAAAFLLIVIWLLALPITTAELKARQGAEHLATWLLLEEQFRRGYLDEANLEQFHDRFVSSSKDAETIDAEMKDAPIERLDPRPGGDVSQEPYPITVKTHWPEEKTEVVLQLHRRIISAPYEVYKVESDARFLPFDQYDIAIDTTKGRNDSIRVLGRGRTNWTGESRSLQFEFNVLDQPKDWDEISSHLWSGAPTARSPSSLRQNDSEVVSFIRDVWKTQHDVWGVSVDSGLFFVAPGILLGAQAFGLLGPLLTLARSRERKVESNWIMAIDTKEPRRVLLEFLLSLVSILWILAPFGIGIAQIVQGVQLHPFESACFWLGCAGLIFASGVNAALLYQIRRLRCVSERG